MPTSRFAAALAGVLLLAGCHRSMPEPSPTPAAAAARIARADADLVSCAHGDAPIRRVCSVEQLKGRAGPELTVRHPDGSFRRLSITDEGHGVAAADGAERATVTVLDPDTIEVAIGADRYRLPATVASRR